MIEFLLTSAVIFAVLTAWQYVDYRYRRFANDNPAQAICHGMYRTCSADLSICSEES